MSKTPTCPYHYTKNTTQFLCDKAHLLHGEPKQPLHHRRHRLRPPVPSITPFVVRPVIHHAHRKHHAPRIRKRLEGFVKTTMSPRYLLVLGGCHAPQRLRVLVIASAIMARSAPIITATVDSAACKSICEISHVEYREMHAKSSHIHNYRNIKHMA